MLVLRTPADELLTLARCLQLDWLPESGATAVDGARRGSAAMQLTDIHRCCAALDCLLPSFSTAAHVERVRASKLPVVGVATAGCALARAIKCRAVRADILSTFTLSSCRWCCYRNETPWSQVGTGSFRMSELSLGCNSVKASPIRQIGSAAPMLVIRPSGRELAWTAVQLQTIPHG
jgi:hypothetical protein